tara:strand:- start:254 stop:382 length:129 start_codon:yes stop_codon:yes gene_type:complete
MSQDNSREFYWQAEWMQAGIRLRGMAAMMAAGDSVAGCTFIV